MPNWHRVDLSWVQDPFTWGRLDLGSDQGTNKFRFRTKLFRVELCYVQDLLTRGRLSYVQAKFIWDKCSRLCSRLIHLEV